MAKVILRNVSAVYGHLQALTDISLEVEDGSFVVVFGPSGAGKTTLLNVVAGLKRPTTGEIYFDEDNVSNQRPWDRNVAMVFENYALYPHWTVYDNIASPLTRQRLDKSLIKNRVHQVASMMGIETLLDRRPAEISNGQKQRVAIGRAMVRDADVLLMDEPLAHLDAKLRSEMRTELNAMKKRIGRTVIYVTHDYQEAMALADVLVVLRRGQIVQQGPPDYVFRLPASLPIVELLGNPPRNILFLTHRKQDDQEWLEYEPWRLRVLLPAHCTVTTSATIAFAIAPHAIHWVPDNNDGEYGEGLITTQVLSVEPQGRFNIITIGEEDHHVQFLDSSQASNGLKPGDPITVRIDVSTGLLYDPESGSLIGAMGQDEHRKEDMHGSPTLLVNSGRV